MNEALVQLRDRMVARAERIVEARANPQDVMVIDREMRRYVEPIISRFLSGPPSQPPRVIGCSPDEIAKIEAAQRAVLPATYREFLELMGREVADLGAGTSWLYPNVVGLKEYARDLLEEWDEPFALPRGAVVVAMHQGYNFHWLDPADGPDPAVWWWSEGNPPPTEPDCASWVAYLLRLESHLSEPRQGRIEYEE